MNLTLNTPKGKVRVSDVVINPNSKENLEQAIANVQREDQKIIITV
jgi:hypothetical protein